MEILLYSLGVFVIATILYMIVVVSYVFTHYEIHKKLFYPFNHPNLVWERENMAIIKGDRAWVRDPAISDFLKSMFKRDFQYCGYVAFKRDQVPEEWHGSYHASGLELLEIHGGITYAEVGLEDKEQEKQIIKESNKLKGMLGEVYEQKKREKFGEYPKTAMNYFDDLGKIMDLNKEEMKAAGYVWVVFGFDCAHSGDEENEDLGDLNHIIKLTVQMSDQLVEFAKVWNLYMATESDKDRCTILDSVRNKAEMRTEMGFGGMLSLLTGRV